MSTKSLGQKTLSKKSIVPTKSSPNPNSARVTIALGKPEYPLVVVVRHQDMATWATWVVLPQISSMLSSMAALGVVLPDNNKQHAVAMAHPEGKIYADLKLEFQEAIFGGEKEIRIPHLESCTTCKSTGAKPGSQPQTCSTCGGAGQVRRNTRTPFGNFTQVSVCPTCNGDGQVIEDKCEACNGAGRKQETKKLKISIPKGVDNGTKLRIGKEGDAGLRGGPPGDLYVYLHVEEDAKFRREGINILSQVKISYLQAILGSHIQIDTVDGPTELNIPAGIQPNTVLKLEQKGVPRLGNEVSRGDHLLTLQIDIPGKVSQEERDLLEKLAKIRGDRVGKGGIGSIFGNVFK
jgi:molecular chaperone DnaJ